MGISEGTALAALISNLTKRAKPDNPLFVAECAKLLAQRYGTEGAARKARVSDSTIQIWVKLADLPQEFKQYIMEGKIRPVAAYRIASAFKSSEVQLEIARGVVNWYAAGEAEVARLIQVKKKHPSKPVEEIKTEIEEEVKRRIRKVLLRE